MDRALFNQTSCIVLSAGSSERMGGHKALLKFDETKTFIEQITDTYLKAGLCQVVVVVNKELFQRLEEVNPDLSKKVLLVINPKPELGRFCSLQTGIQTIKPGNYCFFQNIDNPFTTENILLDLFSFMNEANVIIPVFQGKSGHPVLVNPDVADKIRTTSEEDIRIDNFLRTFTLKRVEIADSRILININSPVDYVNAGF
jgi:molybdenum cofactor cytidylyltransferase